MAAEVRFDEHGLVPAVVQDAITGDVLMLAYMNAEALRLTRATGRAHYWSRGRGTLWRKGETSGNEQVVADLLINCEQNSILLRVRQTGAVCHEGYPTCFYRRLEPDQTLTVVRERVFDPVEVYGKARSDTPVGSARDIDLLAETTRLHYQAYAWLRDNDLTRTSGTSRRLRQSGEDVRPRIADELRELAGVLTGDHRHADPTRDLQLEASQVIYWVFLLALREGLTWAELRPDRALATASLDSTPGTAASLLRSEADRWRDDAAPADQLAARMHATLALVGQACASGGVAPLDVVNADLDEMRARPYLAPFFARAAP